MIFFISSLSRAGSRTGIVSFVVAMSWSMVISSLLSCL